jgi:cellulose synthase/poly-beta-1,6-N-acetylglucosamine synthase-like glycosyltransferase
VLNALASAAPQAEVLLAYGRWPSLQRNLAVAQAGRPFVWFLDSDAEPEPGAMQALLACMDEPGVAVAGGPNLGPEGQPGLQAAFSQVLASSFGSFSVRCRYARVGQRRLASEKELILCNLMVRREAFMASLGFSTKLYPNEENEWLNRMADAGHSAMYEPMAAVRRPRRASLLAFAWQAFRYGRGRMLQTLANPHKGDAVHAVPALFLIYLLALPFAQPWWPPFGLGLTLYMLLDLLAGLQVLLRSRDLSQCIASLALFPLRHLAYGAGWLAGLMGSGRIEPGQAGEVAVERVQLGAEHA